VFFVSVAAKGLGVHQNCAKRENFEGAAFEAFRDRGFGKCVVAWRRYSKRSTMEVDKGGFQHRGHGGHRDAEERRQVEDGLELSKGMVA
jgi:hypothetical protein